MVFRKPGVLLPLEWRILEAMLDVGESGIHGFALAQALSGERGTTRLVSHGTLYKALDRMRRDGLLSAEWESPDQAEAAGRPRRRLYRLTPAGALALTQARPAPDVRLRWGEAPA